MSSFDLWRSRTWMCCTWTPSTSCWATTLSPIVPSERSMGFITTSDDPGSSVLLDYSLVYWNTYLCSFYFVFTWYRVWTWVRSSMSFIVFLPLMVYLECYSILVMVCLYSKMTMPMNLQCHSKRNHILPKLWASNVMFITIKFILWVSTLSHCMFMRTNENPRIERSVVFI